MATSPGNNDHHEQPSSRRRGKTLSGPFPDFNAENHDAVLPIETMRFPWSSPSAPTSPIEATRPSSSGASPAKSSSSAHRRTISGNLLSKFNFLRPGSSGGDDGSGTLRPPTRERRAGSRGEKDKEPTSPSKNFFSRKSIDDDAPQTSSNTSPEKVVEKDQERDINGGGALASALKQSKTRRRKGSLRKTALLGGKKIMGEGRERKGSFSLLQRSSSTAKQKQTNLQHDSDDAAALDNDAHSSFTDEGYEEQASAAQVEIDPSRAGQDLQRQDIYQGSVISSSSDVSLPEPVAVSATRLALLTDQQNHPNQEGGRSRTATMVNDLGSPLDMKSPVSQTSYTSTTTDDDDVLTFERPSKASATEKAAPPPPLSSTATSYFPNVSSNASLATRRSSKHRSPLSRTLPLNATTSSSSPPELGHSYTETAYWGWVILIATWIIFTVGMGSCLEIWSWAWDVGETPYAPPELEDDPTLPIVGYYPALIVLTGVVSWVWITVAWVGMKYFRHAKIEV